MLRSFDKKQNIWLPYSLDVYQFKRGELMGLLREVGFSKITQYSDFHEGFDLQADFYEYVAEK